MDQRSIASFLARKEISAIAIHYGFVVRLSPEAVSRSFITHYLREAIFVSSNSPVIFPSQNLSSTIATRVFSSHLPNSRLRQFES
jgi:hypothetical protein